MVEQSVDDTSGLESATRVALIDQARMTLALLTSALGNPATAARLLHLVIETAGAYQKLLAAYGVPGVRPSHRRIGSYEVEPSFSAENFSDLAVEIQPGGETFAGQALTQILATAKEYLGAKAAAPSPVSTPEFKIESLTRALESAKRGNLPRAVCDRIEKRLTAVLDGKPDDRPAEPEADGLPDDASGAAFFAGMAIGVNEGVGEQP